MEQPHLPGRMDAITDEAAVRARLSDLVVSYFVHGIDSLTTMPRGRSLVVRRVWAATPELSDGYSRRHCSRA